MISFIKQIYSGEQLLDFSFVRIQAMNGPKYFVMVSDISREYHFIIEKMNGDWMIIDAPKVPQWIHDLEIQLIDVVVENEMMV